MGKYSGKVLTVFIAPDGIRICEGENKNGNLDISKFFMVGGVSEFFSGLSAGITPEIVNISGLVGAIVMECKARHVTARRIMVCSDCFGISTEVSFDASTGGLRGAMSGDIKDLFKSKGKNKIAVPPDQMACKQQWGELTMDGSVKKVNTLTTGDKYLLKSLVQEFYSAGYEVIFVSGTQEVLLNFRQTEPASFDSQGKIIFDYDVFCGISVMVKDVPVEVSRVPMLEPDQISERLHSQLNQALQTTGRNPRIYLAGSVFKDTQLYCRILDELANENYTVFDLFNRPEVDETYQTRVDRGELDPIMTPDYSPNIAMLMSSYAKSLISMTSTVDLSDAFKKNSQAIATLVLVAGCVCLVLSAGVAGFRFYNMMKISSDPSRVVDLQNQVATLQSKQASLNSTIETLTQADTTILELMKFIDTNQSDRVSVVSVDTTDMLSTEVSVDTSGVAVTPDAATSTDETVSGSTGPTPGAARAPIIIRGYAKTGNEAVAYFNRLFNYGLPLDPVLNGVERYTLPGGEEVYVFEIEVGGDAL